MKINSQISTHNNIIYTRNELFVVGSSKNTNSFVFSAPDIFFNNHNIWLMSCPCSAHGMTTDISKYICAKKSQYYKTIETKWQQYNI